MIGSFLIGRCQATEGLLREVTTLRAVVAIIKGFQDKERQHLLLELQTRHLGVRVGTIRVMSVSNHIQRNVLYKAGAVLVKNSVLEGAHERLVNVLGHLELLGGNLILLEVLNSPMQVLEE